jgi:hypothetical protein
LPISIGIAILPYRLYEIDLLINRALVYGSLTAFLAGLYAAAIQLFKLLFEGATGETSETAVILTTLILAAAFTPAKNQAQRLVDRYFGQVHDPHKELKAYADQIESIVRVLDIEENASQFLQRAVDSLDAEGGTVYLYDGGTVCAKGTVSTDAPGSVRVPLVYNGAEIGYLALGPRSDGATYAGEDREALEATACQVARAIVLARRALANEPQPKAALPL